MEQPNKGLKKAINPVVFFPPAIILVIAVIIGIAFPKRFGEAANQALSFSLSKFSWFYTLGVVLLILFCIWVAFSKYGNIRLGGPKAKPTLSFVSWFAIALTSGMAIGIVFYGVAEPMTYFNTPPGYLGIEGGTAAAGEQALRYTFLHWTIHPYAIYTSAGICMAFMYYNGKRDFKVSSALYPLLGEKTDGIIGHLVNALAIFTMVAGIGTSFGLGAMQIGDGINYVFNTEFSSIGLWLFIIFAMAAIYITAACSGLHKGIKFISEANMYIFYALMAIVLVTGGSFFILNNTISGIGAFLGGFIEDAFYLEPLKQSGWVGAWSIFYWAWWLSASLIVGLFLVKLAQGRTIRQFIIVNMVAPSLFAIAWFGIFGSASINLEFFKGIALSEEIANGGIQISLFALLNHLPLAPITILLGFLAIVFSFVTLAESMTLTLADMTSASNGATKSPVLLKIFWGGITGLIAFALLLSGGLQALQTSVIVCGIPVLLVLLCMVFSMIKALVYGDKYDLASKDEITDNQCTMNNITYRGGK